MQQSTSYGKALPHASRVRSHQVVPSGLQPHPVHQFSDPAFQVHDIIHVPTEAQVLLSRKGIVDERLVGDETETPADPGRWLGHVQPGDPHTSRFWPGKTGQDPD